MADETTVEAPKARLDSAKGKSYADLAREADERFAESARAARKTASKVKPVYPHSHEFSITRPFRYGWGFTKGTVKGTLEGMSRGGRVGMFTGLAGGFVGTVGMGMSMAPIMLIGLPLAMAVGFIMVGGGVGLATGGVKGVLHEKRKEQAHDAAACAPVQAKPKKTLRGTSAHDLHVEAREAASDANYDRQVQQNLENKHDLEQYSWQDRVHQQSSHHSMGR